jgi:hypothetical protein
MAPGTSRHFSGPLGPKLEKYPITIPLDCSKEPS